MESAITEHAVNRHLVKGFAGKSLHDVFCKALTCGNPVNALSHLKASGIMHYMIPELEETYGMTQNVYHSGTVWEHTMQVVSIVSGTEQVPGCDLPQITIAESDRQVLLLAALLHDIGKIRTRTVDGCGNIHFIKHELRSCEMVADILPRLGFSEETISEVQFLVLHHMDTKPWGAHCEQMKDKKLRRMQYICRTEERFGMLMSLIHADNMALAVQYQMHRQVPRIIARTEQMKADGTAMFGFGGFLTEDEVMEIKGLQSGPQVGECLDYLLKIAFARPHVTKDEIVRHLKGYRLS